jgi:uncharacterized alpha-E superfamily protein
MLSRVADSLYWMSRYMERAENLSRLLDVNLQLMLDLGSLNPHRMKELWEPVLISTGDDEEFFKLYTDVTTDSVIEFLTFHPENPNSILECITNARENARQVREQISSEMWEEINRGYLNLLQENYPNILRQGPSTFFSNLRLFSHLFQGITDATMSHGEGWDFIQVGKYLERGDKTTRIIDAKFDLLTPHGRSRKATDALHWSAILKSCSAHEAYRKIYVAQVEPSKICEFLILHADFPRSIRFCVQQLDDSLRRISGSSDEHFRNNTDRLSGRLASQMNYTTIEEIFARGVHTYMDDLQLGFNEIGEAIYHAYMFSQPMDLEKEIQNQQLRQFQHSQQQQQ